MVRIVEIIAQTLHDDDFDNPSPQPRNWRIVGLDADGNRWLCASETAREAPFDCDDCQRL